MNLTLERKTYRSRLIRLAIPIIIQNLLSSMVNSMDVIMLNFVGQDAISAVSLASQVATILFMFLNGLGTGATMLTAQYYGKGENEAIRVVQGIAMRFSIIGSLLFAAAAGLTPRFVMLVFTSDETLIRLGMTYLRAVSVAYLCWGIIEVYLSVLRSVGKTMISMTLNIVAFVLNIILNAVFIFGAFGLPKMGVMGVALATSLSRLVELVGCLIVSARCPFKLDLRYILIKNKTLFKDFIEMALPALLNDIIWGLAFSVYSVILGHLGSDAVAANSLGTVVRNFGSVMCFGMATAGEILLGQVIGGGEMEKAKTCASVTMRLTILTACMGSVFILGSLPFVLKFADLTPVALRYLKGMMLINSYYIIGAAVNTTLIAGLYRAGGDSKFGLKTDTITMWCYAVPLGFLNAFVLKLPVMWVYFFMCTDEFVKWPWVLKHYFSGKWLNNITKDNWRE